MDAFNSSSAEMNFGKLQSLANIARIVWAMQSTNWACKKKEREGGEEVEINVSLLQIKCSSTNFAVELRMSEIT